MALSAMTHEFGGQCRRDAQLRPNRPEVPVPVLFGRDRMLLVTDGRSRPASPNAGCTSRARTGEVIDIGLLNNMPDLALQATEAQYIEMLGAAAGERVVRLHFFSVPELPRGEAARSHMQSVYHDVSELASRPLDALIVTGNEPRTTSLFDEPYWGSLAQVIDWAEHNTRSTIWSCLAAHAAVLHLDGVHRRALDRKRFGLFECDKVSDHPLLDGMPLPVRVAHSRWNDLPEEELAAHGYHVLTRASGAGVDMFVKQWASLFLFFQGHPEYEPDSLLREYRRDVVRFLRGERSCYPDMPLGYFDRRSEELLLEYAAQAQEHPDPDMIKYFPRVALDSAAGRESTIILFRNWLSYLVMTKN